MGKGLLILGAGGHGKVVREVALSLKENGRPKYDVIEFLDDHSMDSIGKIGNLKDFAGKFEEVFCGIGNNELRKSLLEQAEKLGFHIPVLIHTTAYVSPSASIEPGTVIEPKAIVNANSVIKKGCIISVGAIVDHDVVVGSCAHVNVGAICKAGSVIEEGRKLEAGEVVLGYGRVVK